ncbi:hypothetical protein F2Q68_00025040, partial [Brassica cretica]
MVKLLLDRRKAPFDDLPKSVITMHLVVQPSPTKARPWKKIEVEESPQRSFCSCTIMWEN